MVMMCIDFSRFILLMMAARVVDLPEPVGPVTSTIPFRSWAMSPSTGGMPSCSMVGILLGMTRMTTQNVPRCAKTFTRKRVRPESEYDRSVEPVFTSFSATSLLPAIRRIAICSVW